VTATRPAAALAVAALLAAAAVGCGEKREKLGGTVSSVKADRIVAVTETDFEIDPAAPEIAAPGIVAFEIENRGKVDHALEIELPDGEIDTDSIPPGESETIKADLEPGTYRWYCPLADHADRGMEGEIVVAGDKSGGSGSGSGGGGPGGY
jgi:uncharacterized cupredoxin-like copper-binding protein